MSGKDTHGGPTKDRGARIFRTQRHDTYARAGKHSGTLVCSECGATQHDGRWSWALPSGKAVETGLCPACERIRDGYPAGTIRLPSRLTGDLDEITRLIRNVERAESADHPLERVIAVADVGDFLVITTTGLHIARRISSRLARRFHEKPRIDYPEEQHLIRVEWER